MFGNRVSFWLDLILTWFLDCVEKSTFWRINGNSSCCGVALLSLVCLFSTRFAGAEEPFPLLKKGQRSDAVRQLVLSSVRVPQSARKSLLTRSKILSRAFISNSSFEVYQDALNELQLRKYRAAQEKLEGVLKDDPQNCEVLLKLGQAYLLSGEVNRAIQKLTLAKKVNALDSEVLLWLGKAELTMGRAKEAIHEWRSLEPEVARSEVAVISLAEALVLLGQQGLALRTLQRDLEQNPLHLQVLILSAKIKFQSGRAELDALWSARKDLQIGLSRLEAYTDEERLDWSLDAPIRKSSEELATELKKNLQQVQERIDEFKDRAFHS